MDNQRNWPDWATQPIILEEYNAAWPQRAIELTGELQLLYDFGASVFEHIGSTSVPGLKAKPIIDLMLEVDSFEAVGQIELFLRPAAWHLIPPVLDIRDQRRVFVKVVSDKRYAHLHLVTRRSEEMGRHLAFRDLLRTDSSLAKAYLLLKTALAAKFPDDRDAYSNGKNDFIRNALNKNR